MLFPDRFAEIQLDAGSGIPLSIYCFGQDKICLKHFPGTLGIQFLAVDTSFFEQLLCQLFCHWLLQIFQKLIFLPETEAALLVRAVIAGFSIVYFRTAPGTANSHFLRPAGPHFPASQGHIKRSALEIGRARGAPPC